MIALFTVNFSAMSTDNEILLGSPLAFLFFKQTFPIYYF